MASLSVSVAELNEFLTCPLCHGYFREAHTIPECLHSFCKACILKNFTEHNQKGHVTCPTCKTNLGVYANNKQLIYDRNLQALIDEIFPEFGEQERAEEKAFNAELKAKVIADRQTYKRDYNEFENEEPEPPSKLQRLDAEVSFKLAPAAVANNDTPSLPPLKKPTFKSDLRIRTSKVQRFVHKRVSEEVTFPINPEDIEILDDKGKVLNPEGDLTGLEWTEHSLSDSTATIRIYNLGYRLKAGTATAAAATASNTTTAGDSS